MRTKGVLLVLAVLSVPWSASRGTALKPGKERWPVKTSLVDSTGAGKGVSLADLIALPDAAGVTKNDSRYQSERIPGEQGAIGKEGDLIAVRGWIHLVATDPDGDYHIQVSASPTDGDHCLIVEAPRPEPEYVADAGVRARSAAVREFIRAKLLHDPAKEPSLRGNVMTHPPFVRLTGALFFDDAHVGDQPRGKMGMKAATLWELHPLARIGFARPPR